MPKAHAGEVGGIAGEQLKSFVLRAERLNEEKKALNEDLSDIFAEARSMGYEVKIIKEVIKLRSKDQAELDEHDTLLELYLRALGMRPGIDDEDGMAVATHVHAGEAAE